MFFDVFSLQNYTTCRTYKYVLDYGCIWQKYPRHPKTITKDIKRSDIEINLDYQLRIVVENWSGHAPAGASEGSQSLGSTLHKWNIVKPPSSSFQGAGIDKPQSEPKSASAHCKTVWTHQKKHLNHPKPLSTLLASGGVDIKVGKHWW